jgi:hypothetical protein
MLKERRDLATLFRQMSSRCKGKRAPCSLHSAVLPSAHARSRRMDARALTIIPSNGRRLTVFRHGIAISRRSLSEAMFSRGSTASRNRGSSSWTDAHATKPYADQVGLRRDWVDDGTIQALAGWMSPRMTELCNEAARHFILSVQQSDAGLPISPAAKWGKARSLTS